MKLDTRSAGLALVMLAGALGAAAADTSKDAKAPADAMPAKASSCLSCHGADGRPALADVPIIAGQQPLYLENALHAYKAGTRTGGPALVMQEMVADLSDDDIETLASWFGAQQ